VAGEQRRDRPFWTPLMGASAVHLGGAVNNLRYENNLCRQNHQ